MRALNIAIVGATGVVGEALLNLLESSLKSKKPENSDTTDLTR